MISSWFSLFTSFQLVIGSLESSIGDKWSSGTTMDMCSRTSREGTGHGDFEKASYEIYICSSINFYQLPTFPETYLVDMWEGLGFHFSFFLLSLDKPLYWQVWGNSILECTLSYLLWLCVPMLFSLMTWMSQIYPPSPTYHIDICLAQTIVLNCLSPTLGCAT